MFKRQAEAGVNYRINEFFNKNGVLSLVTALDPYADPKHVSSKARFNSLRDFAAFH
jgi:hypothetical protein